MMPVLEVKQITISFDESSRDVKAVKNLSFHLKKGEIAALVGESGCGKSVLCKSILGILSKKGIIETGQILFNGKDILPLSETEKNKIRGNQIAMVLQNPMTALNPVYTIGQQIGEAITLYKRITRKERKKIVISLLAKVGIGNPEERYYQYPFQMSGGMRQRCVIAIALAGEPEILIADEPTTALDVTVQADILELFLKLQKETGMSMLFVTHDLGVAAQVANRVIIMKDGQVVEEGETKELFSYPVHPFTKQLFDSFPGKTF